MISVAVYGYGNLGRGVISEIAKDPDMSLYGVFSRRDLTALSGDGVTFYRAEDISEHRDSIDVIINCGGSKDDLPVTTPLLSENFCVVDSFDNHARIPGHKAAVEAACTAGNTLSLISAGWDPGIMSLMRLCSNAFLPAGESYTFWGSGVSQGHSDAVRRIDGVLDAREYTVPIPGALDAVRNGGTPELSAFEKHRRDCYVVAAPGADTERIADEIRNMPDYFLGYETNIYFITQEELNRDHAGLPHAGKFYHNAVTGNNTSQRISFGLDLGSNPEFTSSVLIACARAVFRMHGEGRTGCITMMDVPPKYYSPSADPEGTYL